MTSANLRRLFHRCVWRRSAVSVALGMLLALTVGCSEPDLTLYCGAGIRPPVSEIAEEFGRRNGVTVECDYAGSEMLLSRIKLLQRGDLYMPGDVHYVEQAESEGLMDSKQTVCYFVPVIMVQKGNPKDIHTLADLTKPGVEVGLGDPRACAIGRKASKIFQKNDIPEDDINRNVTFRSLTVNELGSHIKLKTLDAVIVWDAVAAQFPDDGEVVPIPRDQNVISTIAIGTLNSTKHPELAAKFVEFVTSDEGREVFKRHHYTTKLPNEKLPNEKLPNEKTGDTENLPEEKAGGAE